MKIFDTTAQVKKKSLIVLILHGKMIFHKATKPSAILIGIHQEILTILLPSVSAYVAMEKMAFVWQK